MPTAWGLQAVPPPAAKVAPEDRPEPGPGSRGQACLYSMLDYRCGPSSAGSTLLLIPVLPLVSTTRSTAGGDGGSAAAMAARMPTVVVFRAVMLACRPQELTASVAAAFRVIITADRGSAVSSADCAAECLASAVHSARHVGPVVASLVGQRSTAGVQGHTVAAVLRPPRPHSNTTPDRRLDAHRRRARPVRFRHGVDGFVAWTV